MNANLLRLAGMALSEVLNSDGPADAQLSAFFRNKRELGTKERAFVAESVYGVLRRLRMLTYYAGEEDARKLIVAWLVKFQGMSLRDLEACLNAQQKEWIQEIKSKPADGLSLAMQVDMPDWLWEKLVSQYGESEALAISRSMHLPATLDLRVNTVKASREDVIKKFESENTQFNKGAITPTPFSPIGLRLPQRMSINRHVLFTEGKIEVQDEGSQLLCFLVAPKRGEMVADFCAGAGGKSLGMGALMRNTGRLYAFDISEKRLHNLGQRLKRSGLSNLHAQVISSENDQKLKRLNEKFNRVLVDAPCSGLGTLRRNPDLKWRQQPLDISELSKKQKSILEKASKLVKSGGRLIYATCSLLSDENEEIASYFLSNHPEFRLIPANQILANQQINLDTGDFLRLFPHVHQTDGFFAAVFERMETKETA